MDGRKTKKHPTLAPEPKRYSADAETGGFAFETWLQQHAPLTAEDIRGLTVAEARKLWLQRREPAKGGAGRPSIEITREAIEAEMKRRRQAGEPTSHKVLGRHFKCSPQTIARRLNEPPREDQG